MLFDGSLDSKDRSLLVFQQALLASDIARADSVIFSELVCLRDLMG